MQNMERVFVSLLLITMLSLQSFAQEQQVVVPYTLADRDRTIRTEAKMDALETKMDVKFEAVNERIDYLFWLQGVIVALILFMLGYTRYGIVEQLCSQLWKKPPMQTKKVQT